MDKTLLFGDGVSELLVNASKLSFVLLPLSVHLLLVLLFELRCLLLVMLFLCVKLLLKPSVLG